MLVRRHLILTCVGHLFLGEYWQTNRMEGTHS